MAIRVGLQSRCGTGNEEKMIDIAAPWEGHVWLPDSSVDGSVLHQDRT